MAISSDPLRAIVLDNDEATGFYHLVFDVWITFSNTGLGEKLSFRQVLDFFIAHSKEYNLFRPGLFKFLKTCVLLREAGRVDAIIMYTHQSAELTWRDWSVPAFLSVLMGHLTAAEFPEGKLRRVLFDHVLTLPPLEFRKTVNGWVVKDFDRILNLYPWKPRDIRQIIFIDDHASPKHIEADTVESGMKHTNSWFKVNPYKVEHNANNYMRFIKQLVAEYGVDLTPEDWTIIGDIADEYVRTTVVDYDPDDSTFLDLEPYMRIKYPLVEAAAAAKPKPKRWSLW